jgi:DNA primase
MNNCQDIERLVTICHKNLKNSKECIKYLRARGLTKSDIIDNKIGFFPQNMNVLLKYVDEDILNKKSILDYSKNSDFLNYFYLVFPIFSEYGRERF